MTIHMPSETFLPQDETPLLSSRRADGWSAANQRLFLEAIAEGYGVDVACGRVGLSVSSAYAFRRTAKGAAFALGWRAGTLLARDCIAETLLVRALEGQVETVVRGDGSTITRHRHDNRLAMSLLARLDRQVEAAPDADVTAARLVAQEYDAFLDLVERDAGPARAGLFVARRSLGGEAADLAPIAALAAADRFLRTGVATAAEIDIADLDAAQRAGWSAEQWARAEAAGLLAFAAPAAPEDETATPETAPPETARAPQHSQHSAPAAPQEPVWWDEEDQEWHTIFPPPEGFYGYEHGEFGHIDYERALSEPEGALLGDPLHYDEAECAELTERRDQYFGDFDSARAMLFPDSPPARHSAAPAPSRYPPPER
ncbi:hypothetical protein [Sphingomonas sp. PB4P5]|uniref:hypothetical protein n=1 Tax=Parasphingomonas puruogangriensis TaxID=3096155 RepID=UPI002FCC3D14